MFLAATTYAQSLSLVDQLYAWSMTRPLWVGLAVLGLCIVFVLVVRWWTLHRNDIYLASRRAELLLRDQLTPQQHRQLLKFGYLDLQSQLEWNRIYRIPRKPGRVHVLQTCMIGATPLYRRVAELCVIAQDPVPDADLVLAHKWMIEADEANYLTIARWIRPPNDHWYAERAN